MRVIAALRRPGNLILRRFVGGLEPMFYKAPRNPFALPHPPGRSPFGKGLNATETAQLVADSWALYDQPIAFMLDASRADSVIRHELHCLKFDLYRHWLTPEARALLHRVQPLYLRPKFEESQGVRIEVGSYLMSGVQDTALTNNVVFWMIHSIFRLALQNEQGFGDVVREVLPDFPTIALGTYDWLVLVNGDDSMGELPVMTLIAPHIQPFFALFGIDMRIDGQSSTLAEVDWCQSRPILGARPNGEPMLRMVRNPRKVVCKTLSSHKWANLTQLDYKYRLATIGACELILNLGIPVLQEFALMLIRCGSTKKLLKHDNSGSFYRAQIEMRRYGLRELRVMSPAPVSAETRRAFHAAFGDAYTPERQIRLEQYLSTYVLPPFHRRHRLRWDLERGLFQ